jgi:predicted nucleotidyltransferase component of viral defense system
MSEELSRPATADALFLWVMHRFAEKFAEHAILRGGMALRLLDSPRMTTDVDYVFVPDPSKKDIRLEIETLLNEIDGARLQVELNSKVINIQLRVDEAAIQIEVSVSLASCSVPMSTGSLARELGQTPRVVRVMRADWALAHKLAAWAERRLLRDLFDCYFFVARLKELPAAEVLDERLANFDSRLPRLRSKKTLSRMQLADGLRGALQELSDEQVEGQLAGLIAPEELAGLALRMRAALDRLVEWLAPYQI